MTTSDPFIANIIIDRESDEALYSQIAKPLTKMIENGDLSPGTRLEDEISMATRLNVSRPTARKALEELTQRGLIVRRRGAGTVVTPKQVHRPIKLTSLFDDLNRLGSKPRTSVLEWEITTPPPGVAGALEINEDTKLVHMRRLRLSDNEPLAILTNWIPCDIAPSKDELSENGLYSSLRSRGVNITVGVQQISARIALGEEARLLNEPLGAALLTMQRTAYNDSNRPVEFGQHVYRASRYSYNQKIFA